MSDLPVKGYRLKDHVADVRLEAWGDSLEETLIQASLGFWALVTDGHFCEARGHEVRQICVQADDLEELTVSLINEQVFILEAEAFVAKQVRSLTVAASSLGSRSLKACLTLEGCHVPELGRPLSHCVKAATYGDLSVSPTYVIVTLDI